MQARFNFVGKLQFSSDDSKVPSFSEGKSKNGTPYQSLRFSVLNGNVSRGHVEIFGQQTDEIKTLDTDKNKITIDWDNRKDEDVLSTVSVKHIIKVEEERMEFIAPWDVIEYIKENKELFDGKKAQVTGRVQKNIYNGKITDRFVINNIYVLSDDNDKKMGLTITEEVFFTKDSIDLADFNSEKKIYLNGYVEAYIDKETQDALVSRDLVFDMSKINFENEKHIKLLNYKLKQFGLFYEDDKIKNNLKAKKVYKLAFIENYVNGAEEVEFDESTLTPNQKEAIELGLKTVDDFKPKGQIYGDWITLYKIKDFDLVGDYSDGFVEDENTISEIEDRIYVAPKEESASEVLEEDEEEKKEKPKKSSKKKEEPEPEPEDDDDDDEDLFD